MKVPLLWFKSESDPWDIMLPTWSYEWLMLNSTLLWERTSLTVSIRSGKSPLERLLKLNSLNPGWLGLILWGVCNVSLGNKTPVMQHTWRGFDIFCTVDFCTIIFFFAYIVYKGLLNVKVLMHYCNSFHCTIHSMHAADVPSFPLTTQTNQVHVSCLSSSSSSASLRPCICI